MFMSDVGRDVNALLSKSLHAKSHAIGSDRTRKEIAMEHRGMPDHGIVARRSVSLFMNTHVRVMLQETGVPQLRTTTDKAGELGRSMVGDSVPYDVCRMDTEKSDA